MRERKKSTSYNRKIKTREEIVQLVGAPPRKKSVVMCHGTFDLVHPGHLRHLTYAKEKGDILIASVTSDAHCQKANHRPYVPEDLRALNLAAIEVIDYVMIDRNATPLESISIIKPDLYAKGFEYGTDGVHPKTKEEIEVLEQYGGEILFTPGDVIYSSSVIIESSPPKIGLEKLLVLMDNEGIKFSDLRNTLDQFKGARVHVIGDTIVDSYTYCSMIGGQTKTPTLSVKYEEKKDYAGGAAIVAKHLRRAGAEVWFSSVLGQDSLKEFVEEDLVGEGIHCDFVIDKTRPTTNKNLIISKSHRLLKIDTLDNRQISDKIAVALATSLRNTPADIVVFSDFRHGIFNRQTIPRLLEEIPPGVVKVADSQVASRWGNILEFQGFDLITPNEREARFALGDQDSVVRPLAHQLYQKAACKLLIVKLAEKGLIAYRADSGFSEAFFTIDSFVDRLIDAVGSGDALLAYATLAYWSAKSQFSKASVLASILGSFAAAAACEKDGNSPVDPSELRALIDKVEKAANFE